MRCAKSCSRRFRYAVSPLNMAVILDIVYGLEFLSQNQIFRWICPYSHAPLRKVDHWILIGAVFQLLPIQRNTLHNSHRDVILLHIADYDNSFHGAEPIVHLLKNFRTIYGTRIFISVFTRTLHWSLS
jgi:hypothetical protein